MIGRAFFAIAIMASLLCDVTHAQYQVRVPHDNIKIAAGARFELSRSDINFEDVAAGSTDAVQSITLTNNGQAAGDVIIGAASEPFTVTHTCPLSLNARTSCSVSVAFAPMSAQTYSSTIKIAGVDVLLTGRGTTREIVDVVVSNVATYVRASDGSWYAAGSNMYGELGLGDTENRSRFTKLPFQASRIEAGLGIGRMFAQMPDGSWMGVGRNDNGQLGLGSNVNQPTLTYVSALDNATEIVFGTNHTFARYSNGSWKATGTNQHGQLGMASGVANRLTFTDVPNLIEVSAGGNHTLAKMTNGWQATGQNNSGQLGLGNTTNRFGFVLLGATHRDAVQVAASGSYTIIRLADGSVWAAGQGASGQLGTGNTSNQLSFMQVATGALEMVSGGSRTFVRKADGSWWGTGVGPLGVGDTETRLSFTQIPALQGATKVLLGGSHIIAKMANGKWMGAGGNSNGQLGLGDTADRASFVELKIQ